MRRSEVLSYPMDGCKSPASPTPTHPTPPPTPQAFRQASLTKHYYSIKPLGRRQGVGHCKSQVPLPRIPEQNDLAGARSRNFQAKFQRAYHLDTTPPF